MRGGHWLCGFKDQSWTRRFFPTGDRFSTSLWQQQWHRSEGGTSPASPGSWSGSGTATAPSCPGQAPPRGIKGFGSTDTAQSLLTALMSSLNKKTIHLRFFWSWGFLFRFLAIDKCFFLPKTILVYEAKPTLSRNSVQETQKCSQLIYSYELFHHS